MPDGRLTFDTRIDTSGFDKGVGEIEGKAEKAGSSIGSIMKGVLGAQIVKEVASAVIDFGKKCISLASDLEEVQNVVDVTFGESAAKIESFSKTATSQFGLSELQVKQYSGTLGAMLKSMGQTEEEAAQMSLDMVGLTGDIASFYNLDHDTAFQKIRSGLSGETEPLKQLGINMSAANLEAFALAQGIKETYENMSEAEKVQLRFNYIMNATSDAQGDFERTSDGFSNQLRLLSNNIDTLSANIGKALLPAATFAISAINSLFDLGNRESNPLLDEINEIAESLNGENGLAAQINTIKNNYAQTSIEIRVDYSKAQGELDEYERLLADYQEGGKYSGVNLKIGANGAEVQKLQSDLEALGYTIDEDEKKNASFGESTLAAVKQYQESSGLVVDGIAGVNTQAALIQDTNGKLVSTVAALTALYPQLQQYVGEDGLFTIESEQVRALIDDYNNLAKAKAYANMLSDYESEYYTAEAQYQVLAARRDVAQEALDAASKRYVDRYAVFGMGFDLQHNSTPTALQIDTGDIDETQFKNYLNYLNEYVEAFEGLNGVSLAELSKELDGFDFNKIRNADGEFEAEATAENLVAVARLVGELQDAAAASLSQDESDMNGYLEAVNTANTELDTAYATLTEKQSDYNEMAAVYNKMFAETGESVATEIGSSVKSNQAQAIQDIDAFFATLQSQIATGTASLVSAASQAGKVATKTTGRGYSHATGIDYVPYDNYAARLHVGEMVLPAAEAARYRAQSGAIDYGALAAAVAAPSAYNNRPIVLQIDGRTLAQVMADENRSAAGGLSKRLAMGVGK